MTGREIVEICASHKSCSECDLETLETRVCEDVIYDMVHGAPSTILKILKKDYGGDL